MEPYPIEEVPDVTPAHESEAPQPTSEYVETSGQRIQAPANALVPPISTRTSTQMMTPADAAQYREKLAEQGKKEFLQTAATAARYIPPAAVGFLAPEFTWPAILAQAGAVGLSELTARRIEAAASDPEMDSLMQDLEVSGAASALDLGVSGLFAGAGALTHALGVSFKHIAGKLFIPSELPEEIATAVRVLGDVPPEKLPSSARNFLRFIRGKSSRRPFALPIDMINAEHSRFINFLGAIARGGMFGRGIYDREMLRNEGAVIKLIDNYVQKRARETTEPEFVGFAKRLLGNFDNFEGKAVGELFQPVEAFRQYLYLTYESALKDVKGGIDGTLLRKYFRDNLADQNGLPKQAYNAMRSAGLVPLLEPAAKTETRMVRTLTQDLAKSDANTITKRETTDLLRPGAAPAQTIKKVVEEKAGAKSIERHTVTERESLVGDNEETIASAWKNIDPSDADKIIKIINHFWKDDEAVIYSLRQMRDKIEPNFDNFIETFRDPVTGKRTLKDLRDDANSFFKLEKSAFNNAAIKSLVTEMKNNPYKVLGMLGGGAEFGDAETIYNNLTKLKRAFDIATSTPRVNAVGREALNAAESFADEGFPVGVEASDALFDNAVLNPIRYRMLSQSVDKYGRLNPDGFLQLIQKTRDIPELAKMVFGGEKELERVKDFMTTLSVIKTQPKEKNLFIQLAQAHAVPALIGATVGGVMGSIFNDEPGIASGVRGAEIGGSIGLLLAPAVLAKVFTNSDLTHELTTGIKMGLRSGRFAIALRKIAEMKYASTILRESNDTATVDFYTTFSPEQPKNNQKSP